MHLRRVCLKLKNEKGTRIGVKSADDVAIIVDNNLDGVDYGLSFTDDSLFSGWIMDSGCSLYAIPNRKWFITY